MSPALSTGANRPEHTFNVPELRSHAEQLRAEAAGLQGALVNRNSQLALALVGWEGDASNSFSGAHAHWDQKMQERAAALTRAAEGLEAAAELYAIASAKVAHIWQAPTAGGM